ncbi:MAG: hypothetical protein IKI34_06175 [Eubacterium sp.]|nr:hypothetical protein [Eubacterium sp.]
MEYYSEWRLEGDEYSGGFLNGISLSGSESVKNMKEISKSDDKTVFKGEKGHIIESFHEEKNSVVFTKSVFKNETEKEVKSNFFPLLQSEESRLIKSTEQLLSGLLKANFFLRN